MKEQWMPIKNYEGFYEISNYGRVKSLKRYGGKSERILKLGDNGRGYYCIGLSFRSIRRTHKVHHLVWDAFGDGNRDGDIIVVDHKNEIKTDNCIDNLQLLTARENCVKYHKTQKYSSKYIGVSWSELRKKWCAGITFNKKRIGLGRFLKEIDAHLAYQKALINYSGKVVV